MVFGSVDFGFRSWGIQRQGRESEHESCRYSVRLVNPSRQCATGEKSKKELERERERSVSVVASVCRT